ncbi:MAG: regulatory protein RecX [Phycisphaerae bacterium]|nr:regulatory protein RecX [Phycisphaerae bacterium]
MSTKPEKVAEAREAAMVAIAGRDHTRQELTRLLERKGFSPAVVTEAIAELEQLGLVDDQRVASAFVRTRLEASPTARTLLESMLEERGVDPVVVDAVLAESMQGRDEEGDALELARLKVRTSPARLPPEAIRRRVYAHLIRRGFDEETARAAVERAADEYLGRA